MRVTGEDWMRLGDAAERVAHFIGHRAFMRMTEGHCAALEIRCAPDGAPAFFCTVYERRPQICSDLARASPECEGERAMKSKGTEMNWAQKNQPKPAIQLRNLRD